MSNSCSTSYRFYSEDERELGRFHNFLATIKNDAANHGITVICNGVQKVYNHANYYLMQERLNIPENQMVFGKGDLLILSKIYKKDKYFVFHVDMDDAWNAYPEAFGNMLDKRFTDVHFAYIAEEPACEVMEIHDDTGIFFNEKYVIDANLEGDYYDNIYEYFVDKESMIVYLKNLVSRFLPEAKAKAMEKETDINKLVNAIRNEIASSGGYIKVHEFMVK